MGLEKRQVSATLQNS